MEAFKSAFVRHRSGEGHYGYYPQPYDVWQEEWKAIWESLIDEILNCAGANQVWYHLLGDTLEGGIFESVGLLSATKSPFYVDPIRFPGGVGYVNGQVGVELSRLHGFPRSLLHRCHEFAGVTIHGAAIPAEVASVAGRELFAGSRPAGSIASLRLCKFGEWIELLVLDSEPSKQIQAAAERSLNIKDS